jgi:hypothetical protein
MPIAIVFRANFAVVATKALSWRFGATLPPTHSPTMETANRLTLLLADTNGAASSTGGLGMLTSHTQAPVVTETTMGSDLLETLQIFTQLALHSVGQNLRVLAIDDVSLSVEKPGWDLVLSRILDDCDNSLEFFRGDFTGTAIVD